MNKGMRVGYARVLVMVSTSATLESLKIKRQQVEGYPQDPLDGFHQIKRCSNRLSQPTVFCYDPGTIEKTI